MGDMHQLPAQGESSDAVLDRIRSFKASMTPAERGKLSSTAFQGRDEMGKLVYESFMEFLGWNGLFSFQEPAAAQMDGVFPEGFYCSTNQRTQIRVEDEWREVTEQEMDCGIVVDLHDCTATCVPMSEVQKGDQVVIGNMGTRVFPENRSATPHSFESVSVPSS